MSFQLDFNKGTVKRDITEIPDRLLEGAFQAIMEAAHLMAGLAQVGVRVEWGNLRDTIRVERGGVGKRWRQVKVRAGGYPMRRGPRAGQPVDYAAIIEARYPFMWPAWKSVQGQVEEIIRRKCLEEVSGLSSVGVMKAS